MTNTNNKLITALITVCFLMESMGTDCLHQKACADKPALRPMAVANSESKEDLNPIEALFKKPNPKSYELYSCIVEQLELRGKVGVEIGTSTCTFECGSLIQAGMKQMVMVDDRILPSPEEIKDERIILKKTDAKNLSFRKNSFDLALFDGSLEEIAIGLRKFDVTPGENLWFGKVTPEEFEKALVKPLSEARRVLRPNGYLVVYNEIDSLESNRAKAEIITRCLEKLGFTITTSVINTADNGSGPTLIIARKSSGTSKAAEVRSNKAKSLKSSSGGQQKIEVIEKVNPPQNKPVLVLCDVHSTLLAPTWEKECREVFKTLMGDYPAQEWMSKHIFGKTDDEILQALISESGKPTSEVADIVEQVRNQIREKETTQEIPGAVDFLWALRRVGIPSAIISGTERELLISQLRKAGLYYATSRYWPEKHIYARTAEDRDSYNRAAVIEKIWNDFNKPTIIYFDDWIKGMQKVRQLGGICVGVPQGEGEVFKVNREKLIEAGAHYILTGGYDYEKIIDEILDPVFVNVLDIGSGEGEGTWTHPTLASTMAGDVISPASFEGIVLAVRKWMAKKGVCNIAVQVIGIEKEKKTVEEAKGYGHDVRHVHLDQEKNRYTGFPPHSFDLITIFAPPDIDEWFVRDLMPEVKRLLTTEKAGGEIWIQPYVSGTAEGYSTKEDLGFPEFKKTLEENDFVVEVRRNNAGEFIVGKFSLGKLKSTEEMTYPGDGEKPVISSVTDQPRTLPIGVNESKILLHIDSAA